MTIKGWGTGSNNVNTADKVRNWIVKHWLALILEYNNKLTIIMISDGV